MENDVYKDGYRVKQTPAGCVFRKRRNPLRRPDRLGTENFMGRNIYFGSCTTEFRYDIQIYT